MYYVPGIGVAEMGNMPVSNNKGLRVEWKYTGTFLQILSAYKRFVDNIKGT